MTKYRRRVPTWWNIMNYGNGSINFRNEDRKKYDQVKVITFFLKSWEKTKNLSQLINKIGQRSSQWKIVDNIDFTSKIVYFVLLILESMIFKKEWNKYIILQ